jgi:hypothetical protein
MSINQSITQALALTFLTAWNNLESKVHLQHVRLLTTNQYSDNEFGPRT